MLFLLLKEENADCFYADILTVYFSYSITMIKSSLYCIFIRY